MNVSDVRNTYITFFTKDDRVDRHVEIPSAALVPENDPTTLFTGSGMQPLLPYLLGENHPKGNRLVDSQKCFRAEDIEEVGDNRHTTFFEMLGNWSLGDYFKEKQLRWFFTFLVDELGIDPNRLYPTVFIGDVENSIPRDDESVDIWKTLFAERGIDVQFKEIGSEEDGCKKGMGDARIFAYDASKNWWSRAGSPEDMPAGEPGGPDSEMFFDFQTTHDPAFGEHCHPNCDCGRFVEIGNSVFMEYLKNEQGAFENLPQKNVDFGGGLERIVAAVNDNSDVFSIDALHSIIEQLEAWSGKQYTDETRKDAFRVIVDHMRGAVFMIGDGVHPTNTDQGYFTRRLIRRSVVKMDKLGIAKGKLHELVGVVVNVYKEQYPNLGEKENDIADTIQKEEEKFRQTLQKGMKEFEKAEGKKLSGKDLFTLFTTYGFPLELSRELAEERNVEIDETGFQEEMEKHKEISRKGAEQKFKGGLADTSERTTMYHTATHLMLAGLRKYVGDHVHQAGSNITTERTRFDFTHDSKVDRETLDKVEQYVNDAIAAQAPVEIVEMDKEEAKASGVEGSFWEKYPDTVHVYLIQDAEGNIWSRELCGGPHVKSTGDIKGTFRITKEEASSAGVRRVKAVLE